MHGGLQHQNREIAEGDAHSPLVGWSTTKTSAGHSAIDTSPSPDPSSQPGSGHFANRKTGSHSTIGDPGINTKDIASLEQWAIGRLQNMATPTSRSRGTTIPGSHSTLRSVEQEAQRKVEERTKRRVEESEKESGSSPEDEEEEDPITLSSDEEEYVGSETPSQSDPVYDPEPPPCKINRPATRSTPGKPTTQSKRKATRNKPKGPSSNTRKKRRG